MLTSKGLDQVIKLVGAALLVGGILGFLWSFFDTAVSTSGPRMSPFTYFSLVLMVIAKLASQYSKTWTKPMSFALLGVVSCGNISSMWIQLFTPELFLKTIPGVVPTSIMTSIGLIAFCLYDLLVIVRKTPKSAFIFDDILLHLALFPGGLSLLGHLLGVQAYMGGGVDPRVGISFLEMTFMAGYAFVAIITNRDLFLWQFLSQGLKSQMIFTTLFINQYIVPLVVGLILRGPEIATNRFGLEFYVMLSGVLATLAFLIVNAFFSPEWSES